MEPVTAPVIILAWLIVGWLPTRTLKHYWHTRDYPWGTRGEITAILLALTGPFGATGALLTRATMPSRWDWHW